ATGKRAPKPPPPSGRAPGRHDARYGDGMTERPSPPTVAVVTVSDRCSRGEAEDRSGPLLAGLVEAAGWPVARDLVPDGAASVRDAVPRAVPAGPRVVPATGGRGRRPRDVPA